MSGKNRLHDGRDCLLAGRDRRDMQSSNSVRFNKAILCSVASPSASVISVG